MSDYQQKKKVMSSIHGNPISQLGDNKIHNRLKFTILV